MAGWIDGRRAGIAERRGAAMDDKTMIDAWASAAEEARGALDRGADVAGVLDAAARGTRRGREVNIALEGRCRRSAKLSARSLGHVDPGATSAMVILEAMRDAARG